MRAARKGAKSTFYQVGLPMIGFVFVGGASLSVFMQNHYDVKDKRNGSVSQRKFDLKAEHDSMINKLVILVRLKCFDML